MKRKVLMVAILPFVLTGCFGSGGEATPTPPSNPPSTGPSPSPNHTPLDPGNVFVDVDNSQGEGDYVGALTDIVASSCEGDGVTWVGSGTLTNPTGADVDYRVWVAFIDHEGETVGLVQDDVTGVTPLESGDYSASMPYTEDSMLSCVLRVERRAAANN
ncbi:MAG: hypothetical protein JW722_06515 [Demequinaceae bacterium]|nr:hypothetical protein [Demequinaceae bacterium]